MNRQTRSNISIMLSVLFLISGCKPIQPFFFQEDGNLLGEGDLSHYMDVATDIEYPDVDVASLAEVEMARAPLTLSNSENFEVREISLEEVTRIALTNSLVIRQLGGRITDGGSNISGTAPEILSNNPGGALTSYDPALVETGNGTGTGNPNSGTGVEAALAEYDAVLDSSITWQKNDRPQNFRTGGSFGSFFANNFQQDTNNFTLGISKVTASGTTFGIRNTTAYDSNNNGSRAVPSDWTTNIEATVSQPLLQGFGAQLNRIQGPQSFQQAAGGVTNQIDGVIISRIRHDVSLADFEKGVSELMLEIEDVYWELYFAYRDLEAKKIGRDSSQETWMKIKALQRVSVKGGEADKEARSRSQYFLFHAQVQTALTNLYRREASLRYLMGLSASDGFLFLPSDEPTTAQVHFDWQAIHSEALVRRSEVRRQKWIVKRRELELIATRNNLMPRLDAVGRYRWLGAGDDLLDSNPTGIGPFGDGSNAVESLTSGRYQEWEMSLQFSMPIGFRNAQAGVRHHQLLLARERGVMKDLELAISHQLSDAYRDLDHNFVQAQTFFNRRVATVDQVRSVEAVYDSGRLTLDFLLDTLRDRADAESTYYRSLVDYNRTIMRVHYRKGSLLEYNGVYLAEGPWPVKAQFDALRRARQRDASTYLDYGFSRPNVISRGQHAQVYGQPMPQVPTPADNGPMNQQAFPVEEAPLENQPIENGPIKQEPIQTPIEKQITTASAVHYQSIVGPLAVVDQASAVAETVVASNELPTRLAAVTPTQLPVVGALIEVPMTSLPVQSSLVQSNIVKPELHTNPYRQEMKNWMDSTTGGLPGRFSGANSLRPAQADATWAADRPTTNTNFGSTTVNVPSANDINAATHEYQTHHTSVETSANAAVRAGTER